MISWFKGFFYFPVAAYFRFFAKIRLNRWKPKIVLVTGSNGKTTLLHLLEAQLGSEARYTHHANSSYGIPFDILDLRRSTLLKYEWIGLILLAPIRAFARPHEERLYIVEADCDRPGEGKFLGAFLQPDVVLWVSTARAHGMNFESLVERKIFQTVEEAIAYEFGYFLEYCRSVVIVNGDSELIQAQLHRTSVKVIQIKKRRLEAYEIDAKGTRFVIDGFTYIFPVLLPEEVFYAITMCLRLLENFHLPVDRSFAKFHLPPGRSSIFQGKRGTTLIDSCYNANLSSMQAILEMFEKYPGTKKWVVIGDMLEQGVGEKEEHEKLAELLKKSKLERIILMGPRVSKYTYEKLVHGRKVEKFLEPKEALDYLEKNLSGGETVLFKGARFMEGIIEHLLKNKEDAVRLSRREKVWEIRREKWGL